MRTRIMSQAAVVAAVAAIALAAPALPASAHVEVSADKPQAGATNVTLTFVGQAESDSAGIRSERIVLPPGIDPADVTLATAPPGWRLLPTRDGVTIGGRALPVGRDATVALMVARLPTGRTRLPFRTIETYGDGTINRWIEVGRQGADRPRKPAPVLRLRSAGAVSAPTEATGTATPSSTPDPAVAATGPAGRTPAGVSVGAAILWLAVGALIVLAGAGAVRLRRRRRP